MALVNVFVSYATEDHSSVTVLINALKKANIDCWEYQKDLPYSGHIVNGIKDGIKKADFFIIFLSNSSLESIWVQKELGYARKIASIKNNSNRPVIIPVFSDAEISANLTIQPLDIDDESSRTIQGQPFDFGEVRIHSQKRDPDYLNLINDLTPKLTMITDPYDQHRSIFNKTMVIWDTLFPDTLANPNSHQVASWIEEANNLGRNYIWPDILFSTHFNIDNLVTGFFYFAFSRTYNFTYVTHVGILPGWRSTTRLKWLYEESHKYLRDNVGISKGA